MNYREIKQWAEQERAKDTERLAKFNAHKAEAEKLLAEKEAEEEAMAQLLYAIQARLP